MRHLFASRVEIFENSITLVDGAQVRAWSKVNAIFDSALNIPGEMMCRLDLNFVRTGKDFPMPTESGSNPDRSGLLICSVTPMLKAGHMIKAAAGPVTGNFVIKAVPDIAVDFSTAHHMEVQVSEVNQASVIYPAKPPG